MTAGQRWLCAIGGLLLVNMIAAVLLAVMAHHGASRVVPGYEEAR